MTSASALGEPAVGPARWPSVLIFLLGGAVIGVWLYLTPGGLLGKADAIGYAVCHRIDLRSFHLGDRQLPLCSRCTGMYLGAVLGFAYAFARGRGRSGVMPRWPIVLVLGAFGLAFAIDGVNSYLSFFPAVPHLYTPNNTLRLITGALLGVSLSAVVLPGFNQTAWKDWGREPVLRSFADLGMLLLLGGGLIAFVLTDNPLILYPLALISSLGVLVLLTTVYAMLFVIVTRRENRETSWRGLGLALAAGLTLAMAQIALFDLARYGLTGTWNGFQL